MIVVFYKEKCPTILPLVYGIFAGNYCQASVSADSRRYPAMRHTIGYLSIMLPGEPDESLARQCASTKCKRALSIVLAYLDNIKDQYGSKESDRGRSWYTWPPPQSKIS